MSRFSDEEVRRYARQMVMPEVGGVGQARIRATSAEARSEVEALYLAAAGVGLLTVPSTEIAEAVRALNPLVEVQVQLGPIDSADVSSQSMRALQTLRRALEL